jgi:hydrogenase expression/formation protein HypC
MCVAVPGKIVSIDDDEVAVVDFDGVTREVSVSLLEDPVPGEYVIVHAGFALHKVNADEADETIELMRQALNELPPQ